MALLLVLAPGVARADCAATPISDPDDMVVSFLKANAVQAASASLFPSAVKEGMLVYDGSAKALKICDGTNWVSLIDSGSAGTFSQWQNGASGAIYYNGGNVGIGTGSPGYKLDVNGFINTSGTGGYKMGADTVLRATNDTNSELTYVGVNAGASATGANNTAVGYGTLMASQSNGNTAIGNWALQNETTGARNTSVGANSSAQITTGSNNVAVGQSALGQATSGTSNIALGYFGGSGITTGGANIVIGLQASSITEGSSNIVLGNQAGNVTTGGGNIIVGQHAYVPSTTGNNQLSIGNLIYGTGLDGTFSTASSGNIGIGTSSPQSRLDVNGGARVGADATCTAAKAGMLAWNSNKLQVCTDAGTFTDIASSSGGSSQWVNGTSGAIYYNGGNVGIGTTTPGAPLDVYKQSDVYADVLRLSNNSGASTGALGITWMNGSNAQARISSNVGSSYASALNLQAGASGTLGTGLSVLYNSYVGVNTQGPNGRLTVTGLSGGTLGDAASIFLNDTYNSASARNWGISVGKSHLGDFGLFVSASYSSVPANEVLTVSSGGNVGIGTASPGYKLEVNGDIGLSATLPKITSASYLTLQSGAGQAFTINTGGASERLRIDSSGNVGIGTASPGQTLHVFSGSSAGHKTARFDSSDTSNGTRIVISNSGNADLNNYGFISGGSPNGPGADKFSISRLATAGTLPGPAAIMTFDSAGNVGIGTTTPGYKLDVNGTANVDTILNFHSEAHSYIGRNASIVQIASITDTAFLQNASEKMRVTSSGNVGIGTTSPSAKLHVASADGTSAQLYLQQSNADNGWKVLVADANGNLQFQRRGEGTSPTDNTRMTVTTSGNVGIGTTSPGAKLDVNGSIKSTSQEINGTIWLHANSGVNVQMSDDTATAGSKRFQTSVANGIFQIGSVTDDNASWVASAIQINHSGQVGMNGGASPSYVLAVNGTAYATGAAGALSDIRHKKNIHELPDGALGTILQLRPVSYEWKEPDDDGMEGEQLGFIAQDVEKILPHVVLTQDNEEKTKGLKYNEFIPVLTKAMQELKADNDNLRAEFEAYKAAHP